MSANLDLQSFRIAAQQREWNTLQDVFKRLITDIDPLIALQIPSVRLQHFLPIFDGYYPEAGWVRELMLTVISYASAPNDLPVGSLSQFPSPGCGNFLMAVFDLARAVQPKYTVFERYSHITNATANSILADLQHSYFSQHDEETYEALLNSDPQAKAKVQYEFWLDDAVAQRDTELWLAIADDLEERL